MTETAAVPAAWLTRHVPRAARLVTFALCALAVVWLIVSIGLPLGRDQGIFAWVGSVMVNGGFPYLDAWEGKGPAAQAPYALAQLLFGPGERAIRVLDVVLWVAGSVAALRLSRVYGGGLLGPLVIASMLFAMNGSYWNMAQPDSWAGLAVVGALALTAPRAAGWLSFGIAGLLLGFTVLIKPNYALVFAAVAVAAYVQRESMRERVLLLVSAAAGGTFVVLATVMVFVIGEAFSALWDTLIVFNVQHHAGRHSLGIGDVGMLVARDFFGSVSATVTSILLIAGLVLLWQRIGRASLPLAVAIGACYLAAASQLKWYDYQFLPFRFLIAFPCVYALLALVDAVSRSVRTPAAAVLAGATALALFFFLALPARNTAASLAVEVGHVAGIVSDPQRDRRFCSSDFCHGEIAAAAQFVRQATNSGDAIYLWGFDALLYVLAERRSASRYGYNYPLLIGSPASVSQGRQTLMAELAARPPAAIVIQDRDRNNLYPQSSREYLERFPELLALLATRYAEAFSNDRFKVYLRTDRDGR